MPARPARPVPRTTRKRTVSAWSSAWWASATRAAPRRVASAASASSRTRRAASCHEARARRAAATSTRSPCQGSSSACARARTSSPSARASGRRPWSTVATSSLTRRRGASSHSACRSAIESGPPETATMTTSPSLTSACARIVRWIVDNIERDEFTAYIEDAMTRPSRGKSPKGQPSPLAKREPKPDNVVALSRYRAQLGRARKLRRGDALLAGPDPERAVRALPGDELYYVIHELGLRDAGDILELARPEQVQAVLDFALWERDQLVPERLGEWLEAIADVPYETIGAWVAGLDVELFALLVRKTSRIYDLSHEEAPDEAEGTLYPTPDGLFVIDVTGVPSGLDVRDVASDQAPEGEESGPMTTSARAVIRIIDGLYRADQNYARRLLVGMRAELDSELEELAYRWRQGRMADLGFSDYYE